MGTRVTGHFLFYFYFIIQQQNESMQKKKSNYLNVVGKE